MEGGQGETSLCIQERRQFDGNEGNALLKPEEKARESCQKDGFTKAGGREKWRPHGSKGISKKRREKLKG